MTRAYARNRCIWIGAALTISSSQRLALTLPRLSVLLSTVGAAHLAQDGGLTAVFAQAESLELPSFCGGAFPGAFLPFLWCEADSLWLPGCLLLEGPGRRRFSCASCRGAGFGGFAGLLGLGLRLGLALIGRVNGHRQVEFPLEGTAYHPLVGKRRPCHNCLCDCHQVASPVPAASSPIPTRTTVSRPEEITHDPHNRTHALLKNLKLDAMTATLPERIALARREQLDYASFLEVILSEEVNRRAHRRTELRLHNAGFEETCRLEDFDWSASISLDRRLLDAVFSLEFLDKHEHVLLVGPAGVGKSLLAQALGYSAVRAGHAVRFSHADGFFKAMAQARVDNSTDRTFRSFLTPDLLILDDLGLHGLNAQQSADLYEFILNRRRSSSFVITSNRAVDEWLSLFDDPILGNSTLDRLANASYQIVIEGASYRERMLPHRRYWASKGVIDLQTTT